MRLGKTRQSDVKQYCYRCREIVDAIKWKDEDTGFIWCECPKCGSEDVEDVSTCPVCGSLFFKQKPQTLCDDCKSRIRRILGRAIDQVYDLAGWKVLDIPREDVVDILIYELEDL